MILLATKMTTDAEIEEQKITTRIVNRELALCLVRKTACVFDVEMSVM